MKDVGVFSTEINQKDKSEAVMEPVSYTHLNRPKRYISRSMITEPQVDLKKLKQQTFGKKWLYEKIDKLEMDLYLLRTMEQYAAIQYIRNGIGCLLYKSILKR